MPHSYTPLAPSTPQMEHPTKVLMQSDCSGFGRDFELPPSNRTPLVPRVGAVGDRNGKMAQPTKPGRRESWLDEVVEPTNNKQAPSIGTQRRSTLNDMTGGPRLSPIALRPTAPVFRAPVRTSDGFAIIEDDFRNREVLSTQPSTSPDELYKHYASNVAQSQLPDEMEPRCDLHFDSRPIYSNEVWNGWTGNTARTLYQPSYGWQKPQQSFLPNRGAPTTTIQAQPDRYTSFSRDQFLGYHRGNDGQAPTMSYVVVEFKLHRAEVYQWREELGPLVVDQEVTMVVVEADRGHDLGKVVLHTENLQDAKDVKKHLYRKHWGTLLSYSERRDWARMNEQESNHNFETFYNHLLSQPHNSGFSGGMSPKGIVMLATPENLSRLPDKEKFESKAKRFSKDKAEVLGINMEVIGVETQFDRQKLTVYYISDSYIDYKALQSELFKEFKCRLWFVALNPRSFHPEPQSMKKTREMSNSMHAPGFGQGFLEPCLGYFSTPGPGPGTMPLRQGRRDSGKMMQFPAPSPWNSGKPGLIGTGFAFEQRQ